MIHNRMHPSIHRRQFVYIFFVIRIAWWFIIFVRFHIRSECWQWLIQSVRQSVSEYASSTTFAMPIRMNLMCIVNRRPHAKSTSHEFFNRILKYRAFQFDIHNGVKQTTRCHLYLCHFLFIFPTIFVFVPVSFLFLFPSFLVLFNLSFFISLAHNIIYHIRFHSENRWMNKELLYFLSYGWMFGFVFSIILHKLPMVIIF